MCAVAVEGSKLEGTGFEKVQIVQTQVAEVVGVGSTGGARYWLSLGCDEFRFVVPFPVRDGNELSAGDRGWREARLATLGTSVIFADDLRKPACVTICMSGQFHTNMRLGGRVSLT